MGSQRFAAQVIFAGSVTPTKASYSAPVALTDAATIAVNLSLADNFSVTLGANRILGTPTNVVAGMSGFITVTAGSFTLSYGTNWTFTDGTAPVLGAGLNVLAYYAISPTSVLVALSGSAVA